MEFKTEKAYLVEFGDKKEVWIPKSILMNEVSEIEGRVQEYQIPEWFVKDKNLTKYVGYKPIGWHPNVREVSPGFD